MKTLSRRRATTALLAVLLATGGRAVLADAYSDARAELVAAYRAQDYATMRSAADRALAARPEHPGALFNKALAEALDGDPDAAMATLGRLAAKRIDFGVEDIDAFASLATHPGWPNYQAGIDAIGAPVGEVTVAATSDRADFIPEGIAVGAAGKIVLGGIRHGQVLIIPGDKPETAIGPSGHWSVFGMRFEDDRGLWFASSRVPQYAGISDRTAFMAGLFHLDLETFEVDHRAYLPVTGRDQVLGDLVITDETIYTTDSIDGPVYRYSIPEQEYSVLVPTGRFGSPQGLVLDESGEHLYVADYTGGLFRVRIADGRVEKVAMPESVSDYGIDGLYRHGDRLIAIQNGIRPHRVTALALSEDGRAIDSAEILAMNVPAFDEPTLGTVVGDEFYFVANSHWNRFDADNNLPDGLAGPVVLRLNLSKR